MTELGEFGMYLAVGITMACFFAAIAPVFKALAKRIEGTSADADGRVSALEGRLAAMEGHALTSGEVDNQFVRLAELEERVDFTERLLAQRESAARLDAGGER